MPGPSGPPSNKRVARNKKTLILCLYLMSFEATRTSSAPAIPLRTSGQDRLSELARPHGCCVRKRSTDGTDSVWCDRQPAFATHHRNLAESYCLNGIPLASNRRNHTPPCRRDSPNVLWLLVRSRSNSHHTTACMCRSLLPEHAYCARWSNNVALYIYIYVCVNICKYHTNLDVQLFRVHVLIDMFRFFWRDLRHGSPVMMTSNKALFMAIMSSSWSLRSCRPYFASNMH